MNVKLRNLINESTIISELEKAETAIKYACKSVANSAAGKFNQLDEYQVFVNKYEELIRAINQLKQKIK